MRRLTVQIYLYLCVGALAVVPVLLLGVTQTERWGAEQVAQSDRESQLAAELLARQTGQVMAMHVREVESLARQVEARGDMAPDKLQAMVTAQRATSSGLAMMYVGNPLGVSLVADPPVTAEGRIAAGTDYSDRDYYRGARDTGRAAISRAQLGKSTRRPNIQIGAPIWDPDRPGQLMGFAEGTVDLSDLEGIAEHIGAHHPGLKMVVLDADGRVLAHPNANFRSDMVDLSSVGLFAPAATGGEIRTGDDEGAIPYRAAIESVDEEGLHWRVIVGWPQATVQASIASAQGQTVVFVGAAIVLSLMLGGLLALVVAHPIVGLTRAADAVAQGDFSRKVPRPRWWHPREIHTLLIVVPHMIGRLRTRAESLEQQIAARTATLVATNRELEAAQYRYQSLFAHNPDAVFELDCDERVRSLNSAAEQLSGYPADALLGRTFAEMIDTAGTEGATERRLHRVLGGESQNYRTAFRHRDGHVVALQVTALPIIVGDQIVGAYGIAQDITARKALEEELAFRAYHDTLTELPNRASLVRHLGRALAEGASSGRMTGVVFIDLDDFKVVNDSLGHSAGDQLLLHVAQRLHASVRPNDIVARLGGDEFVVLLENLTAQQEASAVAERILDQLRAAFWLEGREVFVSASIGLTLSGASARDPDDLLREADIAMYAAKARGKGDYQFFQPDMQNLPLDRLQLETDLRRAMDRDELRLHYQPIVDIDTGCMLGLEALVRWDHPKRGLLPPLEFIPLAESTGLIVPIGRWILQEACRQARLWQDCAATQTPITMSVNISGRQFQDPGLVEDVENALRRSDLPPSSLKLEITESVAMEAGATSIQRLLALKSVGVQLIIDDFGTGYSSLAYLKRFPVDALKIDRSFVDGLGHELEDSAIVRSVISLAKSLGLGVTGEGVETAEQLAELRALGCDEGQGYYFAKPQPSEAIDTLIEHGLGERADLPHAA